ncbi:MAG: hypothetical protein M1399_02795 [Actinobacteria bacterium]|nr:hypothetical protein [Actinomycetota bacterium]MCL5446337.1 hypothetical protein [Actinomycetota bacterium]
MEIGPTLMCELLAGLPSVDVLGIEDEPGGHLIIHIECRGGRPFCNSCNTMAVIKERRPVPSPIWRHPAALS